MREHVVRSNPVSERSKDFLTSTYLCLSIKKNRGSFKRKDDEKKRDSRLLPKKGENLRFILGKVCKKDLLFLAELGTIKPRLINI